MKKEILRYYGPVVVCLLLIALLLTVPTGFEDAVQYQEAQRCIAEVLSVDDSSIVDTGLVRSGEQRCTVRFTNGTFKTPNIPPISEIAWLKSTALNSTKPSTTMSKV